MKKQHVLLIFVLLLVACGGSAETPTSAPTNLPPTDTPTAAPTAPEGDVDEDTHSHDGEDDDHSYDHDHDDEDNDHHAEEVDLTLFLDGALVNEPTIVDCTLSDGTETTCYEITIAGTPANHDIGPFCPETTETDAADAGIWFDGNGVYDVDGAFILGLAELYSDDFWKLYDDDGNVNITETADEFDLAARPNVDPSLYNHCVAGQVAWLDGGEPVQMTVTIPTSPAMAATTSRGGNWGVTLNGVIMAAAAPVDAILGAYTIAVFDDCGGHINPVDGYHLHGARGCSEVGEAAEGSTPMFAIAMDGFPIHSPLSPEDAAAADLDECNGRFTKELGYHYYANPAEENSILTCFKGLTVAGQDGGRGGRPERPEGSAPPADAPETIDEAATVGESVTSLVPSDYLGSYQYADADFGTNVTVVVDEAAGTRTITSNTLPNHEVGDFPNPGNPNTISEQNGSWTYPLEPTFVGNVAFARTPGVAISGVKFEPDTAERVNCESGEVYQIEAIQDFLDMGVDFNNAHVQPTGEYHYHGVSQMLVDAFAGDEDLVHVAFAADGYLMYYSKSGAYQPSYQVGTGERAGTNCTYSRPGSGTLELSREIDGTVKSDWVYDASYGDLDECNGITIDGQYVYLLTDDYPYIPRCLMGEVAGAGAGGGGGQGGAPPAGGPGGGPGGQRGGGINFAAAADTLGITEQALRDAIGGPPPDIEGAAETLGIAAEEIQAALDER